MASSPASGPSASAAFQPPLAAQVQAARTTLQIMRRELPLSTLLVSLARATASVGPLQARLVEQARCTTRQVATVDRAICWSIALYQALCPAVGQERALRLMEQVVVASGQQLMARAFPALSDSDPVGDLARFAVPALQHAERLGLYCLGSVQTDRGQPLRFDITYCRYAELSRLAGVPELGSVFCAVDGPFFAGLHPRLEFSCDERLAQGRPACTFRFTLREEA